MTVILKAYPSSVILSSTQFLYSFSSEKLQIPILAMNWHWMSCTADICWRDMHQDDSL